MTTEMHFSKEYDCKEETILCRCGQKISTGGDFLETIDAFAWHMVSANLLAHPRYSKAGK